MQTKTVAIILRTDLDQIKLFLPIIWFGADPLKS